MAYKYILDIAHIEHIIDLFLEFVSQQRDQHSMKPSFANGNMWGNEGYKLATYVRGTDKLFAKPWNRKAIDSGAVAEMAIRAMSITENNMVNKNQKVSYRHGARTTSL